MDVSLRVDEAERWKADVEMLTDQINSLLDKIKVTVEECKDHMEDDHYFKQAFTSMVVKLANAFDALVESFKEAVRQLGEALNKIKSKAQEIIEDIGAAVSKIRNG